MRSSSPPQTCAVPRRPGFTVRERRGAGPVHRPQPARSGARDHVNIALCVPLGGTAGIWAPSSLACAQLAVAELNQSDGINGLPCRLLVVNAADDAADVGDVLAELIDAGDVDAIVGMHTSAVRRRILGRVGSRIPFVYTPLYEGGEATPCVFAIGETTARQLGPAIRWLGSRRRPRRWAAIGNDYVWPRASHELARVYVRETGAEWVHERYVPFGTQDFSEAIDALRLDRIDAVLVSLVGQDAIEFNRAFGEAGLSRRALRLSCAIGENELLGIGAENADSLYMSCGYFASLDTDANLAFKERYKGHFGERAPTLNTFGQSTYEGLHFLAALRGTGAPATDPRHGWTRAPVAFNSVRGGAYSAQGLNEMPIYLARAAGNVFDVIERL